MPDTFENLASTIPIACLADRARVRRFTSPARTVAASEIHEVAPVLAQIESEAVKGRVAIGYVAYEAAPAFDKALHVHPQGDIPLAWFAIFDHDGERDTQDPAEVTPTPRLDWGSDVDDSSYREAVGRIREWLAAGDTYQVNYTYSTRAAFRGDPLGFFYAMRAAQPTELGVYLDLGRFVIASASPELFFRLDGDRIVSRPMKGTAPRGLWFADDEKRGTDLHASAKERAENVMIVDMVRNDLGRIARTNSVRVDSLFDIERFPTLWQMTSTVRADTDASLAQIFGALFPCASVTGAPKVRTMEIIRELETRPRGAYCGALGWVGPGRKAQFNVGIRTATLDRASGVVSYPVGSGITWDSIAASEHAECRLKASVLAHRLPCFELLESFRWDEGYTYLDRHLTRLRQSATYFGFAFDESRIRAALATCAESLTAPAKVRLLLDRHGNASVTASLLAESNEVHIGLAVEPVDSSNVFLYHKTTQRQIYDCARASRPDLDDVILWNERKEVTESSIANLCVRFGDTWYTPAVDCGLLPGVMRAELLDAHRIREAHIRVSELAAADEIALVNSVRGWMPATLVGARRTATLA